MGTDKAINRRYSVHDRSGNEVFRAERRNDLSIAGAGDGMSWSETPGDGAPYAVYCSEEGGPFGYIGLTGVTGFTNDNIAPDSRYVVGSIPPYAMAA